jgi:Na+-transporting NADH:ubiquinone oxidoreductase subunit F
VLLTLPIREVLPATPRSRVLRIDLQGARFPYLPGQAVLIATHGHGRRKPYSLAASPEDAARDGVLELLIGLNAEGTPGVHLALVQDALVDVEGPLGQFTLTDDLEAERFLFIAGGSGVAPLRAMLRHALHRPHRQIGLLYSARTLSDFAYESELRDLARGGLIELKQTVTREEVGETWNGARGRIGRAALAPLVHDPDTVCFICGPPALVHEMPKLLGELGVPVSRIRIEEWG